MSIYRLADHYPRSDVRVPDIEHKRLTLVPAARASQVEPVLLDDPSASAQGNAGQPRPFPYHPVDGDAA